MKSFNEWMEGKNEYPLGGNRRGGFFPTLDDEGFVRPYTATSPKVDHHPTGYERHIVKFNKMPPEHDEWMCNGCGHWNNVKSKECECALHGHGVCRRQHGGERVMTRKRRLGDGCFSGKERRDEQIV